MLLGRERECARLDALIRQVRDGSGAALVLEGEAGIGKTSLLEYFISRAHGSRILRARGTEAEQDLPFAGLADLLRPVLSYLDRLPGPQRAALAGALAVGPAVPADPFTICAATLSLLSAAAASQPLLAVVDDAHWLDGPSAQAVEFAARRLGQQATGLVLAVRRTSPGRLDTARIDTMVMAGLDSAAARRLLAGSGRAISPLVAECLAAGTGGNPLALLELPGMLTEAQLTGATLLPDPLPLGALLQRAFAQRLDPVKPGTRQLLLLAAAAPVDLATLRRAGTSLALDPAGLAAAEDAGLIRLHQGQVEFTHPLLRSASYYAATPKEQRAAHHALAEVSDTDKEPTRRAWHLAAAAEAPDESVAATLDLAAQAACGQHAFGAAGRAYSRAAELSVNQHQQVSRWIAAGHAVHLSGDPAVAIGMFRRALDHATDPRVRADTLATLAQAAVYTAPPMDLYRELVAGADAVLALDPVRAAILLASASDVCRIVGKLGLAAEAAANAARLAGPAGGIGWLLSQVSLAQVTILTGDRVTGRRIIGDALGHPDAKGPDPVLDLVRIRCGTALLWCEDHHRAEEVLRSAVDAIRVLGRCADLRYGLAGLSELHFRTDEWGQAFAEATEAIELTTAWGTQPELGWALVCVARAEAATGAAGSCRDHLARAVSFARPRGVASVQAMAAAVSGFLELGLANYAQAAADLARAAALVSGLGIGEPCAITWRPDFIESLARLGRLAEAREQLAALDAEASATGSRWAAAAAARCRGLLQDTPRQAVAHLEEAVAIAETSAGKFDQARAQLCLGQALCRARQRAQAQRQLQRAHVTFELLGAEPWAARTAALLASLGVAGTRRREPVQGRLTPQELRVAQHVAEGLSNQEVAARLFISHKTIEVHLGHIFDKLGVRSRTSLARLIHDGDLQ